MVDGLDGHCCLAGSSKKAFRLLIFSIAMGADYSFKVKNIEIWVPAFFKHNNSSVATVSHGSCCKLLLCRMIRLQKGLLTRGVRLENSRGHSPLLLALLDVFSSGNLKVHITLDNAHMGYYHYLTKTIKVY